VLVSRVLQLLALVLCFAMSGGPTLLTEILEDDCATACIDEDRGGCPDEGCADCSIICSSCARSHVVVPSGPSLALAVPIAVAGIASEAGDRVPPGPSPEGVFHPPRLSG
jgi:hypothetical protein